MSESRHFSFTNHSLTFYSFAVHALVVSVIVHYLSYAKNHEWLIDWLIDWTVTQSSAKHVCLQQPKELQLGKFRIKKVNTADTGSDHARDLDTGRSRGNLTETFKVTTGQQQLTSEQFSLPQDFTLETSVWSSQHNVPDSTRLHITLM